MPTKAEKLLEKMRNSSQSWKRVDLEKLYNGFGFVISTKTGGHDKVFHPEFPILVTSLPRHNKLAVTYVKQAVNMVERYLILRGEEYEPKPKKKSRRTS
jgi:hypothetical protein